MIIELDFYMISAHLIRMTKQWKICFAVSEEDFNKGKKLPREVNISEEMRKAYRKLLEKNGI